MGRPKKPAKSTPTAKSESGQETHDKEPVSKADAVRAALAKGLDSLDDIEGFVKSQYGLEISRQMLSSYKAQQRAREAKKAGGEPAKRGPKPKAAASSGGDGDILSALEALKPLIASQGAEKLHRLIDVLK